MLKTNKSKKNVVILALSVMLAIAALFGGTAAWFIASDSASGTVGTGNISVALSVADNFEVENIAAGDNILAGETATVTTSLEDGAYLRLQLSAEGTKATDADITITLGDWVDGSDGYYYYGGKTTTDATVAETGDPVALPTIVLKNTSNAQDDTITVTISVEAVQVAHQTGTIVWSNATAG